ncbi:MAG: SLBB domain-containing protein, partial [Deltaproteobacteria bacterium]|nr:SLBB domain-containing protein [Deltaproteobacteria bacterium]
GGFPTHIKLQAKADTVIANGSECEPLLATDKTFLKQKSRLVVEGLHLAMEATGAKQGFIAVKGHYKDVVEAVEESLLKYEHTKIRTYELDNYYPAGDEFMLVYDVTGRAMPEGGLPLNVGVVVNNVITLAQVAEAAGGKPVTRRYVTITGEVKKPCVVSAPIGATYADLVAIAGGAKSNDICLIDGGPMMGKLVDNWEDGIAKTTSGILALPKNHFVVEMKKRTISQEMKRSRSACCQCFRCTDLCPRHNLGHELYPHMTMRTIDYNLSEPSGHITSAFLCSQCGMCEMVACDIMGLSPRRIFAEYRKQLVSKGIKNPHTRKGFDARESYKNTKVSISTVLKKMGLAEYAVKPEFLGDAEVKSVKIPLSRHTGAPASACVKCGDKVRMCDVVAVPQDGKLGAAYHASIAGTITDVDQKWVGIKG